jgi:hypothetical protein
MSKHNAWDKIYVAMKLTIIIPYRLTKGGMDSLAGPLIRDEVGNWHSPKGLVIVERKESDDLIRAIKALRKNSVYKHDIVVAIDSDMEPGKDWLKEYDGVSVFKSDYVFNEPEDVAKYAAFYRLNATMRDAVLSLPDDIFVCYSYLADLICAKNWDRYIAEAMQEYGEGATYAPMWVEPRGVPPELTWENIWRHWRATVMCHALCMPPFLTGDRKHMLEQDFDQWIEVATSKDPGSDWIIQEPCGTRIYGYFNALCVKNSRLKPIVRDVRLGPGWDLEVEARLGKKICVLRSFLLHLHMPFEFDDKEVEHSEA